MTRRELRRRRRDLRRKLRRGGWDRNGKHREFPSLDFEPGEIARYRAELERP